MSEMVRQASEFLNLSLSYAHKSASNNAQLNVISNDIVHAINV